MQRDAISENANGQNGSVAVASDGYLLYDEDGTAQDPVSSRKLP